jgi:hypothetical protein
MANENEDVPAGYAAERRDGMLWRTYIVLLGCRYPLCDYNTREEALTAIRKHRDRVAEGSPLVAELRSENEKRQGYIERLRQERNNMKRERDALRAEVERLKGSGDRGGSHAAMRGRDGR